MKLKKFNMLTRFEKSELICCCSPLRPCNKYNQDSCIIEEILYDPTQDIDSCIKHSSYKRVKGSIRQVR